MGFVVCQTKLNPDSDDPDNQLALDNCQLLRVSVSLSQTRAHTDALCLRLHCLPALGVVSKVAAHPRPSSRLGRTRWGGGPGVGGLMAVGEEGARCH